MDVGCTNLSCQRGGITVLDGVSFRVPAGGVLALRGPNGIGKTTLLRTLAGLQPAASGEVTPSPRDMAYASHADGVKAALSVTETLEFWARIHGSTDIAPALAAFDLERLAERRAGTLSAGQRRRLGLARLMLTGREIWLLDEPTVSLDAASVALFAGAVQHHLSEGGTAIIATHVDLGLDAAMLDLAPFRARPSAGTSEFDEAFL
ncbi:heme ABC exporter ATP-binding protein CcmA [Roseicyclus sp. F158]|uniref:Heme ABC exporter ATP-binding protein CcmA n=1 Tax=Tropicimonas omnivorans TaxID=3075590 RepID=A0ABU3DIH8_9RHOB|nr:heme ABC exporter ATP-binding protein CcmA [Roseicyclus sp. F158]MDT0683508.1 heme ABC exporter ATP-binding protein CcmA [Roseicyclus sp. F158]